MGARVVGGAGAVIDAGVGGLINAGAGRGGDTVERERLGMRD